MQKFYEENNGETFLEATSEAWAKTSGVHTKQNADALEVNYTEALVPGEGITSSVGLS